MLQLHISVYCYVEWLSSVAMYVYTFTFKGEDENDKPLFGVLYRLIRRGGGTPALLYRNGPFDNAEISVTKMPQKKVESCVLQNFF